MSEVVNSPPIWVGCRFAAIADLDEGKALFIPWEELDEYSDPAHMARNLAYNWGKRLGVKFHTRKSEAGMYIIKEKSI
jgi:hypothetical protein